MARPIFCCGGQKLCSAACDEMKHERGQSQNEENVDKASKDVEEETAAEEQDQNNCEE
jgi:hypothetical protein